MTIGHAVTSKRISMVVLCWLSKYVEQRRCQMLWVYSIDNLIFLLVSLGSVRSKILSIRLIHSPVYPKWFGYRHDKVLIKSARHKHSRTEHTCRLKHISSQQSFLLINHVMFIHPRGLPATSTSVLVTTATQETVSVRFVSVVALLDACESRSGVYKN